MKETKQTEEKATKESEAAAEVKMIGEVDAAQIEVWKKKYGKVYGIEVEGHIGYVRKVDRNTASYALSQMTFKVQKQTDVSAGNVEINMGKQYKTGEAVLNNCWIGGSEEIKTDNDLWVSACIKAGELVEFKEARLKNY